MSQMYRCCVTHDLEDLPTEIEEYEGRKIEAYDAEAAAHEAVKRAAHDDPDYYSEDLYVAVLAPDGAVTRWHVTGEQSWRWDWPEEVTE